ncbi:hypothetical protein EON83_09810 [bacterium]|nr:MAG: hypothetical protein EON83_09810 [bacterium]
MPALVLVTILSANLQHGSAPPSGIAETDSPALPEATLIIKTQVAKANVERRRKGMQPIRYIDFAALSNNGAAQ